MIGGLFAGLMGLFGISNAAEFDGATRVIAEMNALGSTTKETKTQFIERVTPSFRRLVATELMAQVLVGDVWQTMSSSQRAELAHLHEKMVMSSLHGAYDAALPTRFETTRGDTYRSNSGLMKHSCDLLKNDRCTFYSGQSRANEIVVEHRLLENAAGWAVVDILINKLSVQFLYQEQVREALKAGVPRLLQTMRERVARY